MPTEIFAYFLYDFFKTLQIYSVMLESKYVIGIFIFQVIIFHCS